jgi:hypothetical protein
LLTITDQHLALLKSRQKAGFIVHPGDEPRLAGASRSNAMPLPDARSQANLLSEFVLATFGALGLGVPIAAAIIWICS